MSLTHLSVERNGLRRLWIVSLLFGALVLYGCGSSQEATTEEGQQLKTENQAGQEAQKPAEEKPMDQALTNFTGEQPKTQPEAAPAAQPVQPSQLAVYEKQIEDLRTENTTLKQKIVKLEQDNRTLNAHLADNDAKIAAEKDRADKAEDALKNAAAQPAAVAQKPTEEPKQPTEMASAAITNYEEALKAFNARKYQDAMKAFQAMLSGGVTEDLADNCKYWIGESQFALKKYKDALTSFQDVLKYKTSEKKGDAEFMIAQSYERLGNKAKAKEAYEKVVKDYPMSKNVKRAKERWAKL